MFRSKRLRVSGMVAILLFATACATGPAVIRDYCTLDGPVTFSSADVLTPETEDGILDHNRDYWAVCD